MSEEAPRVLIVEHDEAIRQTLVLAVESLGCGVVSVENGPDALEKVAGQVFAVALVESRLPGALSGSETLEALKQQLPSLPVVLLGEPERPADVLAAFHSGAADVLLKPFELGELRAALARALVQKSDQTGLDFHARLELAKTALAAAAFDVAGVHLRAALGRNPLDAEALNLYGVTRELGGDWESATQAYRAAFACDPGYGLARQNLERTSDQLSYIGLNDEARLDLFQATAARIAVPIIDPVRDLPLTRLAALLGGASVGVAVGVLLDPPTEASTRTILRRRGFVRPAGRALASIPCMVDYTFAADRVAAARQLQQDEGCELMLVGEWLPESVRDSMLHGVPVGFVSRVAQLPQYDAVKPDSDDGVALAAAVNLALAGNAQVVLPPALLEVVRVSTLPVHTLFSQLKLQRPHWVPSESYVSVRGGEAAISVGKAAESTIRLSGGRGPG
jgi:CheY-like chemotaxis protein